MSYNPIVNMTPFEYVERQRQKREMAEIRRQQSMENTLLDQEIELNRLKAENLRLKNLRLRKKLKLNDDPKRT